MKVLIWIGCLFIPTIIIDNLKQVGVFLGAIPTIILYAPGYFTAIALCKKWDKSHPKKNSITNPIMDKIYENQEYTPQFSQTSTNVTYEKEKREESIHKVYAEHSNPDCSNPDYNKSDISFVVAQTTTVINNSCKNISKRLNVDLSMIKCDLYIMALFWLRLECTLGCKDSSTAKTITSEIISNYSNEIIKNTSINNDDLDNIIRNRVKVFEQVYFKEKNKKLFINNLITEMGILIAHDIINNGYEPFSLSSPLPILGIDIQQIIDNAVLSFFGEYVDNIDDYVKNTRSKYCIK